MEVKGTVDFGIITIREDEFEAVLHHFPEAGRVTGRRQYNLRRVELANGDSYLVAVLRCIEQGNGEAQSAAHDLLEDLNPQWLIVVGIAGGVPSGEFGLGDVVVSTRIHDFSVEAVLHERGAEYALAGGPVDKRAAAVAANLPALKAELGNWSSTEAITVKRPAVPTVESVHSGDWLYGDDEWRGKVRQALSHHAGRTQPLVTGGAIASSDRLIKDTEILIVWMKMVRQILAIEMESAGVYRAAYGQQVPTLSIRGISDVVGLKRDPAWTQYACYTAAAFALALLRTRPIEPRGARRSALPEYTDEASRKLSEQIAEVRRRKARLQAAGADTSALNQEILGLRRLLREGGQLREGDALGDGRYLLLRRIGRGGFATVWEAHDEQTDQHAAIKVLHSDLARDPMRRERFFRGARVMSELAHEAIVKVLEPHGHDGGFYYFVMEFISGGDLREAVLRGKISSEAILPLILRVGEALALAHERGFVHRDIKPANILLDDNGAPRLTDFDLVGAFDTTGGTRTGALGTFLYAAPELMVRPQDADARADVYGLGMTALFGLFGQELSPDVIQDTEKRKLIDRLPCKAGVKKVLQSAVSRSLAKRYPNAARFCRALAEVQQPLQPIAPPPPPKGLAFEAKVVWNQRDPILKLPSRTAQPEVPFGEVNAQLPDGGVWQFRLVKEFCNVARPVGTDRNQLPELLRRWFGPQAGHPGTAFYVRFAKGADVWTMAPVQQEDQPPSHLSSNRVNRPSLTWIHLSDLRFGSSPVHHFAHEEVLQAIRRDVAEAYPHKAPGFIFITGDIAFSARREQYEEAERWLRDLLKAAQASPASLRMVPGNHDVDWEIARRSPLAVMHRDIRAQWKFIDTYLGGHDPRARELLSEKLSQYVAFVKKIAPEHPVGSAGSVLDWSERRAVHTGRRSALRIAGLCSVWVSDEDDAGRRLIIGESSLQELHPAEPNNLLIVLTHHPFHWFHGECARSLKERLEKKPYLHLCGHATEGELGPLERLGTSKFALRLSPGAVHEDIGRQPVYSWGALQWRNGRWELGWAPRVYAGARGMRADRNNYELDDAGFHWEPIELPWEPLHTSNTSASGP
jgi:serine/threonine protein kinase/nucleoside phosphorylase